MKLGVAGVTGIFLAFILLCCGIFLACLAAIFWTFLFAVIGLGDYAYIPGYILGIITAIGLIWLWLSDQ